MDSLNNVLKSRAIELGICQKYLDKWDHNWTDYDFCQNFKTGIDFCIQHDFPSLDFIRKFFDKSSIAEYGVFVDELPSIPLRNGTYICLGDCNGELFIPRWGAVLLYLRHDSKVNIHLGQYSRVTVCLYDRSEVEFDRGDKSVIKIHDRRT